MLLVLYIIYGFRKYICDICGKGGRRGGGGGVEAGGKAPQKPTTFGNIK